MKIAAAIRSQYDNQRGDFTALKSIVDDKLRPICSDRRWHYESRVKELVSYALKVDTGRVPVLDGMEDFFACSIVVRNSGEIMDAIAKVEGVATVQYRRPADAQKTTSRPSSFEFDDLRLYCALKEDPTVQPGREAGLVFEVQIKTFLFHAWALATHDLTYKADDVSWGRERIAFQVRAMLEHAEITIQEAATLAGVASLDRENGETAGLREIIRILKAVWEKDQLPNDVRRLASNIQNALFLLRIDVNRWEALLRAEVAGGPLPLSESPYQVTVRLMLAHEQQAVERCAKARQARSRLVIYKAIAFPAWITALPGHNFLIID